jgi:hypothetical protein
MIKIDASTLIPKRLGPYLLSIVPGCFFEMTMAFGDPTLARGLIDQVRQVYPFQGYMLLIIFAISCFFVGQTFYYLAWFFDWSIDISYRSMRFAIFHLTLGSDWLYRGMGRWQGMRPRPSARYLWRPIMWARKKKVPFEIRPILTCQRRAALQLLRRKYGVNVPKYPSASADEEWQAWLAVLGKAPAGLRESLLLMRVTLACGFGELATLYLCKELRNPYFVVMCATLLLAGALQLWKIVRFRNEPIRRSITRLSLIVEELAELFSSTTKAKSPSSPKLALQEGNDNGDDDSELSD